MEPIEIPVNRGKMQLLRALAVPGFAIGLFVAYHERIGNQPLSITLGLNILTFFINIVWIFTCLFGFYFLSQKLKRNDPGFIISDVGIVDNSSLVSRGLIAWELIDEFVERENDEGERYAVIRLKDARTFILSQNGGINKLLLRQAYSKHNGFTINHHMLQTTIDELLPILVGNLRQHRR